MTQHRRSTRPRPSGLPAVFLLLAGLTACGGGPGTDGEGGARGPDGSPAAGAPDSGNPAVDPVDAAEPGTDAPPPVVASTTSWREGQVSEAATGHATLRSVRTGRHEDYDRLVLEFEQGVPGYTVRFADRPLHQCGSGFPIEVEAPHTLQIELQSVAAHDDEGRATVEDRDRRPGLTVVRSAELTCDFEGVVEWVLGLDHRTEFRVFRLDDPTRLVIDLRHP